MKFEELVPPLELCKHIPAGEFAESALSWLDNSKEMEMLFGITGDETFFVRETDFCKKCACFHERYPAPTLQEILAEILCCNCYRLSEDWTVALMRNNEPIAVKSTNPATAALKLWLKLKGIENV